MTAEDTHVGVVTIHEGLPITCSSALMAIEKPSVLIVFGPASSVQTAKEPFEEPYLQGREVSKRRWAMHGQAAAANHRESARWCLDEVLS